LPDGQDRGRGVPLAKTPSQGQRGQGGAQGGAAGSPSHPLSAQNSSRDRPLIDLNELADAGEDSLAAGSQPGAQEGEGWGRTPSEDLTGPLSLSEASTCSLLPRGSPAPASTLSGSQPCAHGSPPARGGTPWHPQLPSRRVNSHGIPNPCQITRGTPAPAPRLQWRLPPELPGAQRLLLLKKSPVHLPAFPGESLASGGKQGFSTPLAARLASLGRTQPVHSAGGAPALGAPLVHRASGPSRG